MLNIDFHSKRNLLITLCISVVMFLTVIYAFLPGLIGYLVKARLAEYGVTTTELEVGYPGLSRIQIHSISLQTTAGVQKISVQIPNIDVNYRLGELLSGEVTSVHIPSVTVHAKSAERANVSAQSGTGIPLAMLISGKWLTQLPFEEFQLGQLAADVIENAEVSYTLNLTGHYSEMQLQLNGEIHQVAEQQPIQFALAVKSTGETRLSFLEVGKETAPMLEWLVNSVYTDNENLELKGVCTAQLGRVMPIIVPWLTTMSFMSTLGGDLTGAFEAKLPVNWNGESDKFQFDIDATVNNVSGQWGEVDSPKAINVTSGQVSSRGRLLWQQSLQMQGMLRLKNLAGHYNEITFAGLNGELPLIFEYGLKTTGDARISINAIDVGFPVENTDMRFSLAKSPAGTFPLIKMKHFNIYLLGGEAHAEPFEFDVGRDKNTIDMRIEGLSLSKIIELEQQEGITGTGVLDGRIPIELSDKEIVVTNGNLSAREPGGVIRFTPTPKIAALAETNRSVGMMVKALSNFQYQVLEVNSDYQAGGDLLLKVRLEGKNPDWQGGQPVNLNLNLQENIPALLRSLQLSDEISEKVRKHYQKTP